MKEWMAFFQAITCELWNGGLLALFFHFTFAPIKENVDRAKNMGFRFTENGFETPEVGLGFRECKG